MFDWVRMQPRRNPRSEIRYPWNLGKPLAKRKYLCVNTLARAVAIQTAYSLFANHLSLTSKRQLVQSIHGFHTQVLHVEDQAEDKVVEDKVVEDKVVEDKVVEDKVVEDKVVEDKEMTVATTKVGKEMTVATTKVGKEMTAATTKVEMQAMTNNNSQFDRKLCFVHNAFEIVIVLTLSCVAVPAIADKPNAETAKQQKLKADVFAGLTELTLVRDEVQERFALFATGMQDQTFGNGRAPFFGGVYRLMAGNAKSKFLYQAFGFEKSEPPHVGQNWSEVTIQKPQLKHRSGWAIGPGYTAKPKDKAFHRYLAYTVRFPTFDPFDDLVLPGGYSTSTSPNTNWIESLYFHQAIYDAAEEITGGDLRSRWKWDKGDMHYDIELTQSKRLKHLPVQVKFKSRMVGRPHFFGHNRIEWRMHPKLKKPLPYRIEIVSGGMTEADVKQETMLLDWRVGTECGDDLFDFDTNDNRIPFSKYYDFQFDVAEGRNITHGTPWEEPEGLFPKNDRAKGSNERSKR
ncbi:hypothetical protein K239x_57670 [Planctomycetes bacterium K23_9]|uniref:Uncharacterized protein n=2 Tax=Stieleria marina TaxID=1930275 RepID=A0A517P304_9BACT|nr:hypothetical protein K239x_57670 [Planctomycetes bacterium K23_9]